MQELFSEILEQEGVIGCLYLGREGRINFCQLPSPSNKTLTNHDWGKFLNTLGNVTRAEILFTDNTLFFRRTNHGHLLLMTSPNLSGLALIELQLDLLVERLDDYKPQTMSRFFRKK